MACVIYNFVPSKLITPSSWPSHKMSEDLQWCEREHSLRAPNTGDTDFHVQQVADAVCVPANRMRKDCHAAAHHERGNVEEVDSGGGSSSSNNSTGNSSQSSSSQPTRDGTPQLQTSSQEVHQRAGICTIYLAFSGVFSWGVTWADAIGESSNLVEN